MSWPRSVGQEPLYYNALNTGRPADKADLNKPPATGEDKYVSRYIDEQNSPQFPFGYGLSYTNFRYSATELNQKQLSAHTLQPELGGGSQPGTVLTANAEVTNTGSRTGEEVVQVYVRLEGTSVAEPVRALKGFQRISLAPGETRKVDIHPDTGCSRTVE